MGRRDNKQKLSNSGHENFSYGPKYNRLVCDIHLIIESNVLMDLLNTYLTYRGVPRGFGVGG